MQHRAGDFWATSVLGGKHITNICSRHVLCLLPRCLAKLGKLLGISSPSCWDHLLWIPKESGLGHVTGSLQPSGPLSGPQIHVMAVGFCSRKELRRHEEEEAPMTPSGVTEAPGKVAGLGWLHQAFGSCILDAARETFPSHTSPPPQSPV